ncbi:hypothetical protein JZ751_010367 [Albula glossodonta]|uniref:Beta-soluble NSF attachment protein n=1 Tax=Albula glossodonta TaxID=121402 RepID=A0A8T2NZX1_9TELE|nr:hypothetical protein JZ751_010367 [Albula glossodonta]
MGDRTFNIKNRSTVHLVFVFLQWREQYDLGPGSVVRKISKTRCHVNQKSRCGRLCLSLWGRTVGRFTIAAKHHITIAEVYESELVDIEKAIAHYEQAADYYKGEESNSSANKCLLKVASYSAQLEQYQKAIEIYEQVGTNTMDNPLLKYSAKEYFFKASLCHFIVDELNAKLAVEKYEEMFPAFSDSRECKLLKKLLEAHEEQNSEAFTEAVKEFDSVSRLDQWLTTMLLRIKKTIQGDAGDLK